MLIIRNGVMEHSLQTIESVIVASTDQITKYFIAESNYPPPIKKSTLNYLDYYPYYILVDQEKKFCSLLYYICREFCTSEDYGNQISALNIIKILLNSKENNVFFPLFSKIIVKLCRRTHRLNPFFIKKNMQIILFSHYILWMKFNMTILVCWLIDANDLLHSIYKNCTSSIHGDGSADILHSYSWLSIEILPDEEYALWDNHLLFESSK